MISDKRSAPPTSVQLKPAVHLRILKFLNEATSPEDVEFVKPLFVHDHEGVPIQPHVHFEQPVIAERVVSHEVAKRIFEFREMEHPLGFTDLKELFGHELFGHERSDGDVVNTFSHHFGEKRFGEWARFPQPIPRRGPGTQDGVVHAALLHTGEILFITADETTVLWNPENETPATFEDPRNQPHTMPQGYSQLCGHHALLSDGRLLTMGGGGYGPNPVARWGYTFDPIEKNWTRTSGPMSDSRWYPTSVALGDKRVLVACGHGTGEMDIYDEATDRFTRVTLDRKPFPSLYPGLHLLPNNSILYTRTGWGNAGVGPSPQNGDEQSAYFKLSAAYAGSWTNIALASPSITRRTKGMSVMLFGTAPLSVRVIVIGGTDAATNDTYESIDATGLSPSSSWTAPVMSPDGEHRSQCSAVLLPDGNVFVSGGIQRPNSPSASFDPRTNAWSRMAELPSIRDYHSVSVLLPSGKIMMAGWFNATIEIFSPPYIFHGSRPTIARAPESVRYGQGFIVESPDAAQIGKAVLVRPMAVTHQTDSSQRVIEVSFHVDYTHPDRLVLTAPTGGDSHALAPPGYYMLFILDREDVPSVAKWIHLVSRTWHKWFRIGPPEADVPQRSVVWPVSRSADRIDTFVIGNNGGIYTTGQTGGGVWEAWHAVGDPGAGENVPTNSVVSAISRRANRLDIFVVGHNGGIYTSGQKDGGLWDVWHAIGDPGAGENVPTRSYVWPVSRIQDRIDLFVVGHNGGIYTTGQTNGSSWEAWHPVGNPGAGENVPTNSVASAVARNPNRLDIFVVGHNGGIYTSGQSYGGSWEGWHPIGDPGAGATVPQRSVVFPISRSINRLDIFVVGHNGGIYTTGQTGGGPWEAWHPIGDPGAGETVPIGSVVWAVSHTPDRIDIFVIGYNGGIYTSGQSDGGAWEYWHPIGDPAAGENVPQRSVISAIAPKPDRMDVFVVGHNGGIYSNWWD